MKTETLLDVIGEIDPELIADTERYEKSGWNIRSIYSHKWKLIAACIALIICASFAVPLLYGNATVGSFTLDVNPSVEYTLARNNTVKDIRFINEDAEKALRDVSLKKQSVEVAIERTLTAYEACGYIGSNNGTVLITFDQRITGNTKLKASLTSDIQTSLGHTSLVSAVVFRDESENELAKEIANEFGLSIGKAECIIDATEKFDISIEDAVKLPLDKLIGNGDEAKIVPIEARYIGIQKAKQIATDDAGCSDEVTFSEETLVDGGIKTPYYWLVFTDGQTQWSYKIDAVLGAVLEKDKVSLTAPVPEFISLEEAKRIAIKDAGLSDVSQKINFTKAELYRNQGAPCYILEFHTSKHQYHYKVDAKNGSILEKTRYIPLSAAKQIAIDDAGCSDKVTFSEETLVDGGIKTPYYRLVFADGQTQWTYRIDAVLGVVLEKNKVSLTAPEPEFISLDEAKRIAIKDAGCSDRVTFSEEALVDGGIKTPYYRLVFTDGQTQWTYRIDAVLGTVLEKDKVSLTAPEPEFISLDEAKRIAIKDAGCSDRVTFSEETLVDGGIKTPYYRLVFTDGQTQWTYRIDAVLGIILEKDKVSLTAPEPDIISLEEAKQIAITAAGLDGEPHKLTFVREELIEFLIPCYHLVFHDGEYYYYYDIVAEDGSIIREFITPILLPLLAPNTPASGASVA